MLAVAASAGGATRAAEKVLAAPAVSSGTSWSSVAVERAQPKRPKRARGSLTQAQLATAERFALRYGIALPMSGASREAALHIVHSQMQNPVALRPSVRGDMRADARKARGTQPKGTT